MIRTCANTIRVSMDKKKVEPPVQCSVPDLTGLDLSAEEKEKVQALLYKH